MDGAKTIEQVKDRIAKLLALAGNNSSEEEARAAILKARSLMAEFKLRPDDCEQIAKQKVVRELVGISVTGKKYAWAVTLSAVIAARYCCRAYRSHRKGAMTQRIGFVGLEDDFTICSRIFAYAFDCVTTVSESIFNADRDMYTSSYRRKLAEAYGWAFVHGLNYAFEQQDKQHQEWGLVMTVPQVVNDVTFDSKKPSSWGNDKSQGMAHLAVVQRGFEDGKNFDPASRISRSEAPLSLAGR